jgi:hypothetical protein
MAALLQLYQMPRKEKKTEHNSIAHQLPLPLSLNIKKLIYTSNPL